MKINLHNVTGSKTRINTYSCLLWIISMVVLLLNSTGTSAQTYGSPIRYEAESGFNSNITTATANAGYSGSGYVTGFLSTSAETKFYKGADSAYPLTKLDIRYANGTGASVTNLALMIGSNYTVQNLVFPATASWSTWSTLTVVFTHDPNWGGDIRIVGTATATASVNIDYTDVSVSNGTLATVATPTFSPAAGTYTSAQTVTISSTTSGATIYYTQDGSAPTTASSMYGTAINVSTSQTLRAIASKSGMSNSSEGLATYTINIPPPAPGAFTQTAPASNATGVSITPVFSWAASSNATSYSLVVSTSSTYASPVINQTGITTTSYTSGTSLSNSTVYYWKVTATNSSSTVAANAGVSFTTTAPLPVAATPAFSPVSGTYTSAQSVSISSATTGATIYYTTNGNTPTTSSSVYSTAINVGSTQTVKAIATKSGYTNSAVGTVAYTINIPVPAPGAFTQTTPASAATGVATKPAFSWATSSNAASYTLVVATNSSYTSPVINQTGVTGTSFTLTTALAYSTLYYWKVTAVNATSSTIATNAGLSFTTSATPPPVVGQPGVTREFWAGISGTAVSALTSNANYPNNPTSSSIITSFDAPQNVGETYGQRIKGYITPTTTGSYTFYIAADDDAELWLSTDDNPANKVKIASVTGWTNYIQYNKYGSQTSVSKTLTAGNYYYIEVLHKEDTGGDNCTVAWSGPGVNQSIISGSNLVTAPPVPLPAPGAFSLTAPANAATGVSLSPTFTWGTSSDAASYTLVVSTSSSYTNPIINQSAITGTSYATGGLAGTTTYYWKVTATNATSSTIASNAGRSFTTLTPPVPGAFTQTTPAASATAVSRAPTFTWAAASDASTYSLIVSTSSSYASPAIDVSGLTSTSYSASSNLTGNTVYYWKVTAVNSTGSTVATNAGISFTTSVTTGTYYYVSTAANGGIDAPGRGGAGNPFATPSYAATQIAANQNNTIYINAGTYTLTQPVILPLGVNIEGAGTSTTILKSSGVTLQNGVTGSEQDYPLWIEGSLIQLGSPIYSGANPRYGDPSLMIPAQDGNQTLSGFTIDGNNKSLKAGVWVLNRNNVTVHHVNFVRLKDSGAVFTRGDMYYYIGLADGKWMKNLSVHDCTFTNSGSDLNGGGQNGNLRLGGIDGADIYNITINDTYGEGIKFAHVGHHRNTKIHDCTINLTEKGAPGIWGDWMAIELWNCSYGNEVYNIVTNGWISLATHGPTNDIYQPTIDHPWNLKIHDVRMVSTNLTDELEAVECAMSGVEFYNNYFQDRPYFIAAWGGIGDGWGGTLRVNKISIHNNVFAKVGLRNDVFGFGDGAAVFTATDAQVNNIKIYNNVFDNMGNSVSLSAATNVDVANNVFLNSGGDDLNGNAPTRFKNNLRYNTAGNRPNWQVSGGADASNYNGTLPGFNNTGNRWDTYYKPSSSSSFVLAKGLNVGIPYNGSAPDIGRWEWTGSGGRQASDDNSIANKSIDDESKFISSYPNPTTGLVKISSPSDSKIEAVQVMDVHGRIILNEQIELKNTVEVNISEYPNDIYIFRVKHQKGVMTRKISLMK